MRNFLILLFAFSTAISLSASSTTSQGTDGRAVAHPILGWTTSQGRDGRAVAHPILGWTTSQGTDGRAVAHPILGWTTSQGRDGRAVTHPILGWTTSQGTDGRAVAHPILGWTASQGRDGRAVAYKISGPYENIRSKILSEIYSAYPNYDLMTLLQSMGWLDTESSSSNSSYDEGFQAASNVVNQFLAGYNVSTLQGLYEKGQIDGSASTVEEITQLLSEELSNYNVSSISELYEKGKSEGEKQGKDAVLNDPASYKLISQSVYESDVLKAGNNSVINYTTGWFYQKDRGWMWTNNNILPWIYSVSEGWLFFKRDGEKNRIYSYKNKQWTETD